MMLALSLCILAALPTAAKPQHQLPNEPVWVMDVATLPTGDLLVARSDGFLATVDPATGKPATDHPRYGGRVYQDAFARHPAPVAHLAVDPRGELVAASSSDGRVALWEVRAELKQDGFGYPGAYDPPMAVLHPTPEPWNFAVRVEWTHDGEYLVTGGESWGAEASVQLWSRSGELVWTGAHAEWVAVSPTESLVALVREDEVEFVRPGEQSETISLEGARGTAAFSPDGTRLAVGGIPKRLWVVDVREPDAKPVMSDPPGVPDWSSPEITCVRWSPNGKWLGLTVGAGLHPLVVDPSDGSTIWDGDFHGGRMGEVFIHSWTPDNRILTGIEETYAVDPSTGAKTVLSEHEHEALVAVPRGLVLVSGGALLCVDPATGERIW